MEEEGCRGKNMEITQKINKVRESEEGQAGGQTARHADGNV